MSTWSRGEKITKTVEITVPTNPPWGAAWNQVHEALGAVVTEWERVHGRTVSDDSVLVHARDDEIVISFEVLP